MMKLKGKESLIRNHIKAQEQKISKAQKRIDDLNQELAEYLFVLKTTNNKVVDDHKYCGKILYTSKKYANHARRIINRDLIKIGKKPMKRSYFCEQCKAWHLTTIPHYIPFPENETT